MELTKLHEKDSSGLNFSLSNIYTIAQKQEEIKLEVTSQAIVKSCVRKAARANLDLNYILKQGKGSKHSLINLVCLNP